MSGDPIEQAAPLIRSMFQLGNSRWQHNAAQALAEAGLLKTQADMDVIAAAEAETDHRRAPRDSIKWYGEYTRRVWALEAAVDRLRTAREETT